MTFRLISLHRTIITYSEFVQCEKRLLVLLNVRTRGGWGGGGGGRGIKGEFVNCIYPDLPFSHLEPARSHGDCPHLCPTVALPGAGGSLGYSFVPGQLYETPNIQVLQGNLKVKCNRSSARNFSVTISAITSKVKTEIAKE